MQSYRIVKRRKHEHCRGTCRTQDGYKLRPLTRSVAVHISCRPTQGASFLLSGFCSLLENVWSTLVFVHYYCIMVLSYTTAEVSRSCQSRSFLAESLHHDYCGWLALSLFCDHSTRCCQCCVVRDAHTLLWSKMPPRCLLHKNRKCGVLESCHDTNNRCCSHYWMVLHCLRGVTTIDTAVVNPPIYAWELSKVHRIVLLCYRYNCCVLTFSGVFLFSVVRHRF